MPRQTICPKCNKPMPLEAALIFSGFDYKCYVIQCSKCGYPIGTIPNLFLAKTAIRNIEEKTTGHKSL
jgi:hypothetical protein